VEATNVVGVLFLLFMFFTTIILILLLKYDGIDYTGCNYSNSDFLCKTQNQYVNNQDEYMSKASRRRAKRRKNRERRNNEIINTPKTKHKLETDEMFKKMGIIKENTDLEKNSEENKN
jgi:hypothetical protein